METQLMDRIEGGEIDKHILVEEKKLRFFSPKN